MVRLDESSDRAQSCEALERAIEQHYDLTQGTVYVWKFAACAEGSVVLASIHGGVQHAILVRVDGTCTGV
jgi:hypothetical protein